MYDNLACPQCRGQIRVGSSRVESNCGHPAALYGGIPNWVGQRAHVLSPERDDDAARSIVRHIAHLNRDARLPPLPLDAHAAEAIAAASGLTPAEVSTVSRSTTLVQILNNAVEYAMTTNQRVSTPTGSFIRRNVELSDGDSLLDLGCSAGRYLLEFAERGCRLAGLDIDAFAISVAKYSWQSTQRSDLPELVLADALSMPFESRTFTHVTSWVVLSLLPLRRALREIRRVLRPGGTLSFTIEGPGFVHEMRDKSARDLRTRVNFLRWKAAALAMEHGVDWQGRRLLGRLAGVTTYKSQTIERVLKSEGFDVEKVEVLTRYGSHDRLVGVVATVPKSVAV